MEMTKTDFQKIRCNLKINTQAFIDGKFCDAANGSKLETTNPATGEVITSFTHCGATDVDRAVSAARRVFNEGTWSRATPEYRKELLFKLADLIEDNNHELAVLESIDAGKTITDCLNETGEEAVNYFRWYAELADKIFGKVANTGEDALALIVKEPVGVVGAVVPWNFPFLMTVWKVASALAAGCSIVVKPAEQTPLSALKLAELVAQAGIPDGVVNILPGLGETTGQAIGLHNDIDMVTFTGSTEVGRMFMRYSGDSNLKGVGLELGGKSPFIVLDDADINDDLIEDAAMAAFWNGGQNCSANMRQIIAEPLVDEFLDKISKRVAQFKLGDPLDPETTMGSMISTEHKNMVLSYINKGCSEGAKLLTGGDADRIGNFIEPAIFDGVRNDMTIAREEIFGPVLGVMPVKTLDEALSIANDTAFGLHATVFTRDIDRAISMARHLPCGTVAINGFTEGDIKTPFGGYKQSGSLARENGTEALDQYLQTKTIWITTKSTF